ncbi:MAG: phosphoribosylaminoimidazolesuccinocarboxamide synthase [Planctomycetota bacterium]
MALFQRGTEVLGQAGHPPGRHQIRIGHPGRSRAAHRRGPDPDSSRFWSQADYRIGTSPPSYDKQILRDHLETLDWNKEYPAPNPSTPRSCNASPKATSEICKRITGSLPEGVNV